MSTVKIMLKVPCHTCDGSGYTCVYVYPDIVCDECRKQIEKDPSQFEKLIRSKCKQRQVILGVLYDCREQYCPHHVVITYGDEFCSEKCSKDTFP